MVKVRVGLTVVGVLAVGGCQTAWDQRKAEIDAAYQRGEISFVEREQLTHEVEQERSQAIQSSLNYWSQWQQRQQQQAAYQASQNQVQQTHNYQVYDRNGNYVGRVQGQ